MSVEQDTTPPTVLEQLVQLSEEAKTILAHVERQNAALAVVHAQHGQPTNETAHERSLTLDPSRQADASR